MANTKPKTTAKTLTADELSAKAADEVRTRQAAADAEVDREIAAITKEAEAGAKTQGELQAEAQAKAEEAPTATLEDVLGKMADEEPEEARPDTLFVEDLTSHDPTTPRVHRIMVKGQFKDYGFLPGKPVELPFGVAAKFLIDDAWVVTDHEGNVYRPSPKRVKSEDIKSLSPTQVIADLSELTTQALYVRSVKFPGGEVLTRATSRDEFIEFLAGAHAAMDGDGGKGRERLFSGNMMDMDDKTIGSLLGSVG